MSMLAEGRKKARYVLNPRTSHWCNDNSKFGQRLLEKMGWKPGNGLGVNQQGETTHVKVSVRQDNAGVGFKDRPEDELPHQNKFSELLEQLSANMDDQPTVSSKPSSLEKKSQHSRTRVHYHKMTRGKDLSRYSQQDLACILGIPTNASQASQAGDLEQQTAEPKLEEDCTTKKETEDECATKKLKRKKKVSCEEELLVKAELEETADEKVQAKRRKDKYLETAVEEAVSKKNKKRKQIDMETQDESRMETNEVAIKRRKKTKQADGNTQDVKNEKMNEETDTVVSWQMETKGDECNQLGRPEAEGEVETEVFEGKNHKKANKRSGAIDAADCIKREGGENDQLRRLEQVEDQVETDDLECKKRKKKKKSNDAVVEGLVTTEGDYQLRRLEQVEDQVETDDLEGKKHKKKKRKHRELDAEMEINEDKNSQLRKPEEAEDHGETDNFGGKKHKKKKRNREETDTTLDAEERIECKMEEAKKSTDVKIKRRKSVTFSDELFQVVIIPSLEDIDDDADDDDGYGNEVIGDDSVIILDGVKYINGLREQSKVNGPQIIKEKPGEKTCIGQYCLEEVFEGFRGSNVAQLGYAGLKSKKGR